MHNSEYEGGDLPIHFFTLVLNGEPFIRHHLAQFEELPFDWHWHLMEGVAKHKFDTAWSLANGASIPDELHHLGRSNDGTSAYLDEVKARHPDRITIYRKPEGVFWEGKLEMVNAPLGNIHEPCLLWQVDADECWDSAQIIRARQMFLEHPEKRAAFFRCNFYVGPAKVISSYDTYGNQTAFEWLRLWRFRPGDRWISHEPPTLCRALPSALILSITNLCERWGSRSAFHALKLVPKALRRLYQIKPNDVSAFSHDATKSKGLVFDHYAYVLPVQIQFKEIYYGYTNALKHWEELQSNSNDNVLLKNYFPWVNDNAVVTFGAPYKGPSCSIYKL
jgi:hypothetical protein